MGPRKATTRQPPRAHSPANNSGSESDGHQQHAAQRIVHVYQPTPTVHIHAFDGTTDVNDFIDTFDSQAYALEWPRDKQARFFQSYLQGEAKMFYNQLQVNVKQDIQ